MLLGDRSEEQEVAEVSGEVTGYVLGKLVLRWRGLQVGCQAGSYGSHAHVCECV